MQNSLYSPLIIRLGQCTNCGDCCILYVDGQMKRCFWYDVKSEKHCMIYDSRPKVCQIFPRAPADNDDKPLCGYYFVDEHGNRIDGNMDRRTHLRLIHAINKVKNQNVK